MLQVPDLKSRLFAPNLYMYIEQAEVSAFPFLHRHRSSESENRTCQLDWKFSRVATSSKCRKIHLTYMIPPKNSKLSTVIKKQTCYERLSKLQVICQYPDIHYAYFIQLELNAKR